MFVSFTVIVLSHLLHGIILWITVEVENFVGWYFHLFSIKGIFVGLYFRFFLALNKRKSKFLHVCTKKSRWTHSGEQLSQLSHLWQCVPIDITSHPFSFVLSPVIIFTVFHKQKRYLLNFLTLLTTFWAHHDLLPFLLQPLISTIKMSEVLCSR